MSNLKIDQEEFNRKTQHILDTVVKPQVERYEKAKADPQTIWWEGKISDGEITVTDNSPGAMTTMSPTDLENERFKYNASDYNPLVREKDHPATIENTIPMEMGSNYASLDTVTFKFIQDANCVDGPSEDIEELIVEAKSSLGIDADGGAFFVLKTKQWAIDDANEMFNLLKRCENSINAIVGK